MLQECLKIHDHERERERDRDRDRERKERGVPTICAVVPETGTGSM